MTSTLPRLLGLTRVNTNSVLPHRLSQALILQGQCNTQVLAVLILLQQRLRQATRLVLLEESTCAGVPQEQHQLLDVTWS